MWSLIAIVVAVLIGAMYLPHLVSIENSADLARTATFTAQQAQMISTAAQGYISEYTSNLEGMATSSSPAIVTVSDLINTGFLPAGFSSTDQFGGAWQVEVLQPTPGILNALVVTTGGSPLSDDLGSDITADTGSNGGWYPQNLGNTYPPNQILGAGGGWTMPVTHWMVSKGEIADYVQTNGTGAQADYLYRNGVPGNPQLNTMTTPLIMAASATVGSACSSTGAIAQDGSGAIITCQAGKWTASADGQWKSPVSTYSALPAAGNTVGDVRITTDTGRGFEWNGSTWQPLSIDQNGNLTVPNDLTVTANETVNGTSTINGVLTAKSGLVLADATAQPGGSCTTVNQMAADSDNSGLLLSCRNIGEGLTWQPLGGTSQRMGRYTITGGTGTVPAPSCSAGGAPQIMVNYGNVPLNEYNNGDIQYVVTGAGPWTVEFRDGTGAIYTNATGIASVYCTYP